MTEPRKPPRPQAPSQTVAVPVDEQTRFYGEGEEYVNAQGFRYRQQGGHWVLVEPPPEPA